MTGSRSWPTSRSSRSIPATWSGRAWRCSRTRIGSTSSRGYRLRLLSAAFRNHMHWSEFIGGDVVISPPHAWQKRFNSCDVEVKPRIDTPVAPHIVEALQHKFVDFRRAVRGRWHDASRIRQLRPDGQDSAAVLRRVSRPRTLRARHPAVEPGCRAGAAEIDHFAFSATRTLKPNVRGSPGWPTKSPVLPGAAVSSSK